MKDLAPAEAVVDADDEVHQRILGAAFKAFTERGFARTSTLEIATRAKVSKRDLYASFASKQAMLVACIKSRSTKMQLPADLLRPQSREALTSSLKSFAVNLLTEVTHPSVIAMFRLAISEANSSPEVAQALEGIRQMNRRVVRELILHAQSLGLIVRGDAAEMADEYLALLWEDLKVSLLMGVVARPNRAEVERRAFKATTVFLRLHPEARHGVRGSR
jgi:AcrR family transcriptional regulator